MSIPEQQPNTSSLQTIETELSLTKQEMEEFRKLPKEEQEKQKEEKLAKLKDLQVKLDQSIQDAIKTGKLDEAKRLKEQLEQEVQDLTEKFEVIEKKFEFSMEITPDPDITSVETTIARLEAQGHKVGDYAKDMLTKVNWQEKLNSEYEIVSLSVGELFGDTNAHTYADIKAKAKENGLDLIPAALAPTIRLNYEKTGGYTAIAMNAIRGRDGNLRLFNCHQDGSGSWLNSNFGHDDYGWFGNDRFFFVRK